VNDLNRSFVETRRHPGRGLLVLGVLGAVVGPAAHFAQLQFRILTAPWYAPLLATAGLALVVVALLWSRSVWRWAATVLVALVAAAQWGMFLIVLGAPAYAGPVKTGSPFPEFTTTLADGSTFDRESLKGDQSTVMVFFRGRW
jgi:hypothetical protein